MHLDASTVQFKDRAIDSSVYPVTLQKAVYDTSLNHDLTHYITEYNVSEHQTNTKDWSLIGTNTYTLSGAIKSVPMEYRRGGVKLSFRSPEGAWEEYQLSTEAWSENEGDWIHQVRPVVSTESDYVYKITDSIGNVVMSVSKGGVTKFNTDVRVDGSLIAKDLIVNGVRIDASTSISSGGITTPDVSTDSIGTGSLFVQDEVFIGGQLAAQGNAIIMNDLEVHRDASVYRNLNVVGKINARETVTAPDASLGELRFGSEVNIKVGPGQIGQYKFKITDDTDAIVFGIRRDNRVYARLLDVPEGTDGLIADLYKQIKDLKSELKPKHKILVIGDDVSRPDNNWTKYMMEEFSDDSECAIIARYGSTVKDNVDNRPRIQDYWADHTSNPVDGYDPSTNNNTFACLCANAVSGDYRMSIHNSFDCPDIIIIQGGYNDAPDSDSVVENYADSIEYYVRDASTGEWAEGLPTPSVTPESRRTEDYVSYKPYFSAEYNMSIPQADVTNFMGAYQCLVHQLKNDYPDAQIYIATCTNIGKFTTEMTKERLKVAEQQRICARALSCNIIDWQTDAQISLTENYHSGDGTDTYPFQRNVIYDRIHEMEHDMTDDGTGFTERGMEKLGKVAAHVIKNTFLGVVSPDDAVWRTSKF